MHTQKLRAVFQGTQIGVAFAQACRVTAGNVSLGTQCVECVEG